MRLPELRDELPNQTKEALGLQRKAEQLSELPADDAEGDAVEIPCQDGAREKSGEKSQPGDAAADAMIPASTVNTMVSEMYRCDRRRPTGRWLPRPTRTSPRRAP